ncbi:MAG: alanine dehydrogenase, partial [Gemmatimonadota bacterium]|nr:alanine dehydrogenase [Gemmatimonadota bacterium]
AIQLANKGWKQACADNRPLKLGVNAVAGSITYQGVADAFGLECRNVDDFIGATHG